MFYLSVGLMEKQPTNHGQNIKLVYIRYRRIENLGYDIYSKGSSVVFSVFSSKKPESRPLKAWRLYPSPSCIVKGQSFIYPVGVIRVP